MKTPKIWFDKENIFLETKDGKKGSLLLKKFPSLYNATNEQRKNYTFSPFGIHWPDLDEDLSFDGFFYEEKDKKNPIASILN